MEYVLVNPGGHRKRRKSGGKSSGHKRTNAPKKRRKSSTRRNMPAALMPAATTAAEMVLVPAGVIAGNPGKRRRKKKGGGGFLSAFRRRRRNPSDSPMDFVTGALPVAGGLIFGLRYMHMIPGGIGKFAQTPVGTAVAAYAVNRWGGRILGDMAGPAALGLLLAAGMKFMGSNQLMGLDGLEGGDGLVEGDELAAIHAVELDGVAGYFVPQGLEGAFAAPLRRRLPPLRPGSRCRDVNHDEIPDAVEVPVGVAPRLWFALDHRQRTQIEEALHGPRREAMLAWLRGQARARGLIGELGDDDADLAAEMRDAG